MYFPYIGQSDGSKSNKKSKDYVFLHILLCVCVCGGGGGVSKINGMTLTKFNTCMAVDHLLQ